ncbi:hypothetical protein HK100_009794, partial [Physocladia obscura]
MVITASALPAPRTTHVVEIGELKSGGIKVTVFVYVPAGSPDAVVECEAVVGESGAVTKLTLVDDGSFGVGVQAGINSGPPDRSGTRLFYEGRVPVLQVAGDATTTAATVQIAYKVTTTVASFWVANGDTATVIVAAAGGRGGEADIDAAVQIAGAGVQLGAPVPTRDAGGARVAWRLATARSGAAASAASAAVAVAVAVAVRGVAQHVLVERAQPFWLEGNAGGAEFRPPRPASRYMCTSPNRIDDPRDVQLVLARRTDGALLLLVPFPPLVLKVNAAKTDELFLQRDPRLDYTRFASLPSLFVAVSSHGSAQDLLDLAASVIRSEIAARSNDAPTPLIPFSPSPSNPPSQIWDHFAWCTWDAFYREVSEKNILAGLKEFHDINVPVEVVLIDDGWQDVSKGHVGDWDPALVSFEPNYEKFPNGLGVCKTLKEKGVKYVGVWHTLIGYWSGVSPDGPIAKEYKLRKVERLDGSFIHIVDPEDVSRFYEDMHEYLRKNG